MKKRGVGEGSKTIISGLDLEIIDVLLISKKGLGIMELKEEIKVAHNSLKPHIDKLLRWKLIEAKQVPKSRKVLLNPTKQGETLLYMFYEKGDAQIYLYKKKK